MGKHVQATMDIHVTIVFLVALAWAHAAQYGSPAMALDPHVTHMKPG